MFVFRLRNWESRERRKAKEYEREKERERCREEVREREAKRLKQFLEDYDDERDDHKYYKLVASLEHTHQVTENQCPLGV